jgi:hypothetical protein
MRDSRPSGKCTPGRVTVLPTAICPGVWDSLERINSLRAVIAIKTTTPKMTAKFAILSRCLILTSRFSALIIIPVHGWQTGKSFSLRNPEQIEDVIVINPRNSPPGYRLYFPQTAVTNYLLSFRSRRSMYAAAGRREHQPGWRQR